MKKLFASLFIIFSIFSFAFSSDTEEAMIEQFWDKGSFLKVIESDLTTPKVIKTYYVNKQYIYAIEITKTQIDIDFLPINSDKGLGGAKRGNLPFEELDKNYERKFTKKFWEINNDSNGNLILIQK